MGLDNLTTQNNPIAGGDGVFDFIDHATTQGGTVNAANGRIFFPVQSLSANTSTKKSSPTSLISPTNTPTTRCTR